MPNLFPGIVFSIFCGIPGIWLASWFSSPRIREKSFIEFAALMIVATPKILPMYAIATLLYGSLMFLLLRAIGQLSLHAFLIASILPVIALWSFSLMIEGWEPRAFWALGSFASPALCSGAGLWWFTIFRNHNL
jgi:hypothetical protein